MDDSQGFVLLKSARGFSGKELKGKDAGLLGVSHPLFSKDTKMVVHWAVLGIEYSGGY